MKPLTLTRGAVLAVAVSLAIHAGVGARDQQPAPTAAATTVAIRGGTVLTITGGTIQNGTVIVRDGKIAAVGANLAVPEGAQIVDATGKFVMPGIIDAHQHIALDSINEGATTVSSMTGTDDVLDPTDVDIYRDLAGGVTTANLLHGSANPIGGKNTVIKMRWGKTRGEELVFVGAPPGIKFALGENPKDLRQGFREGPVRYPITRMGVEYVIRDAFTRAKVYQKAWKEYDRRKSAGETVVPPRRDLQLEPLVEVLDGKRLVHAHCYRADEILMLMRLADEMGFKITTFQHVLEGYKVAKEIAAHGAGGSTFIDSWGGKPEMNDGIPYNPAVMWKKGILVSLNSDSAERSRRLNTDAAKAVKFGGVPEDEALKMITINAAKQLKIDAKVGSIEAGKDADLVIWTHHPLSTFAIVERVFIDGTVYYDRQADLARLTKNTQEKQTLASGEGRNGTSTSAQPSGNTAAPASSGPVLTAPSAYKMTPGALGQGVLAITNARIYPVTKPLIEKGTIVIRDGLIEAVGANVAVPAGAKVIDAVGANVYPGWITANSSMGLSDPGLGAYADENEMLDFNPHMRTVVAYHNESDSINVTRANGVTTAAVIPGGGILGGQVAVMNLDGYTWEDSVVRPTTGVSFQFPQLGQGSATGNRTYEELKGARDEKLTAVSQLFSQVRAYIKGAGPNRQTDWMLESLVPVIDRTVPLFTEASQEADIRAAVAFAEKENVRIIITGGIEAARAASLLKEKNVPVIFGPVLTLPRREDDHHAATFQAAGELVKAGVKIAIASGDANNARMLPYHAAMAVAWGLPREEAVKAITINAAELLGVADRLGSIEPGKVANLQIAKGDPLEITTAITHVIIAGRDVNLMNKHLALYERYLARP